MSSTPIKPSIFVVAGEPSGDMHGANLVRELLVLQPDLAVTAVGGDRMQAAGAQLIEHIRDLSCVGLVEVIKKLPSLYKIFKNISAFLEVAKPQVIVLIDFPDFNMRLAKVAKALGIRVVWYVSPQVWAWRKGRVKKIASLVDLMLVIFPFEKDLYQQEGLETRFVGHPLVDELDPTKFDRDTLRKHHGIEPTDRVIGLLPGSRYSEFERLFPAMQATVKCLQKDEPNLKAFVSVAKQLDFQKCKDFAQTEVPLTFLDGGAHDIMAMADFCVVASGTATLEIALFGTPMVVVYKMNPITFHIMRSLVTVKHFSLVNIVADNEIVPERLQSAVDAPALAKTIKTFWTNEKCQQTRLDLHEVSKKLGVPGASKRVAEAVLEQLST